MIRATLLLCLLSTPALAQQSGGYYIAPDGTVTSWQGLNGYSSGPQGTSSWDSQGGYSVTPGGYGSWTGPVVPVVPAQPPLLPLAPIPLDEPPNW